ncbi:DUF922 domain-containing protein [Roseovarius sp. 2305UL8-3]|uniref:DUF922 domain-containing protein n=1 Tax=Roseovarius conchicola TaxID=3121636 RepID=UPI0035291013
MTLRLHLDPNAVKLIKLVLELTGYIGVEGMVGSNRNTHVVKLAFVLGTCLALTAPANAEPRIIVIEQTYPVDATTARGLVRQMSTRGRIGFWAFTRGWVSWKGQCEVTVKIRYTLPEHTNPGAMSPELRAKWERMKTAMRRHEERHGQHSINAGREIEQAGCRGGNAILRKWRQQDKAYDARTRHGRTEGVILK